MNSNKRFTLSLFTAVIMLAMLAVSILPMGVVKAENVKGLVTIPTIVAPSGVTTDTNPKYQWTPVPNATEYHYRVFKVGVTAAFVDKTPKASTVCTSTLCTHRPTNILKYANYTWRIQAKVGGVWQNWSPATAFTVSPPPIGFSSDFNADMNNWGSKTSTNWTRSTASGFLYTYGTISKWSSAVWKKSQAYSNFDFYARVKRIGSAADANCMDVRMGNTNITSNNRWQTGYAFCYNNAGQYQIAKRVAVGNPVMIQDWTVSPVAINANDWNKLRVIAVDSDIFFFINDALVKKL